MCLLCKGTGLVGLGDSMYISDEQVVDIHDTLSRAENEFARLFNKYRQEDNTGEVEFYFQRMNEAYKAKLFIEEAAIHQGVTLYA